MNNLGYRKYGRSVKSVCMLLLFFAVVTHMRMSWDAGSFAAEPTPEPESAQSARIEPPVSVHSAPPLPAESSKFRIVIDAGHGGKDPGATGVSGAYEKEFNLSLAERVNRLLGQDPLFETLLTREEDQFIELEDRAAIANEWNADVLVSIHANTYKNQSISGTETLFYSEMSIPLAQALQEQVAPALNNRDRGLRKERLRVLSSTEMPAVIVEVGYLTNPEEERKLLSDKGQELAAAAIYEGLKKYFAERTPLDPIERTKKDETLPFPSWVYP